MSAGLRVFGFGYQISKPIIEYPSGLKSYPCPYPRAQNTTRIRAQWVRYPRICGYFVPVAIFKLEREEEERREREEKKGWRKKKQDEPT